MKKLLVATFLLIVLSPVRAQDKIVLINGDTIMVKVKKMTGGKLIVERAGIEVEINTRFITSGRSENGTILPIKGPEKRMFWEVEDVNTVDLAHTAELEAEADLIFASDNKVEVDNPVPPRNWADRRVETKRQIIMYAANAYLVLQKEATMVLYFKPAMNVEDLKGKFYEYQTSLAVCASWMLEGSLQSQKKHGLQLIDGKLHNNNGHVFEVYANGGYFIINNSKKNGKVSNEMKYFFIAIGDKGMRISRLETDTIDTWRYISIDKTEFTALR